MSYIKFHGGHIKMLGGQFYVCTRDTINGDTRATSYEWTVRPCHVHGLDDLSANNLYDFLVNGMDVQLINVCPYDVRGLHE